MAILVLTKEQFDALGRELVDAHIANFTKALIDHSSTVDEPAPTDHVLIEEIVRQHDGKYIVRDPPEDEPPTDKPRDLGAEFDVLTAALIARGLIIDADLLPF